MARRRYQQPKPFKEGNYWWLRVWDTSPTGSRKRQRIRLADADVAFREAQKIAEEKLVPMNQGFELSGSAMRLTDFMLSVYIPRYLQDPPPGHPAKLASTTRDSYRGMISKYLRPDLGKQCLRDLTEGALEDYFAQKALGVTYPVLSKIRDTLSSVLRAAVKVHYLSHNPMADLELPKDRRARRAKPTITPEWFEKLVQLIAEPYATMVFVAVWTGLRVSELIGLKWRCIHEDSITIEERYCRGDWSAPKTEASAATIGVAPVVIARLQRLRGLTVKVRAGGRGAIRECEVVKSAEPDDLVFQSLYGGHPMNDQNILKRHIKPVARKIGLAFVNWRCLRTSHATWLVQAGADPKSVQGQMRHSRISTTMDIYAQIVPASQQRAVEQLAVFAGGDTQSAALDSSSQGWLETRSKSRSKTVQ